MKIQVQTISIFLCFFIGSQVKADSLTEDLIKKAGFPVEKHVVTTDDGYFLTLHRVKSVAPPVLLVHPMATSGVIWVLPLQPKAKPIVISLLDHSYDIWILHHRGTKDSLQHVNIESSNPDYWNFTLHELAVFDVKNTVDYILNTTSRGSLNYVGASQGASLLLMLLATNPEYNQKIFGAHLIAPIFECNVPPLAQTEITNTYKRVMNFVDPSTAFVDFGGPHIQQEMQKISTSKSEVDSFLQKIGLFFGKFNSNLDYPFLFNLTSTIFEERVEVNIIKHFSQICQSHNFARFDYGEEENKRIYGSNKPPTYDMTKITAPITIVALESDVIANLKDCEKLGSQLSKPRNIHFTGNHLDFWATQTTINAIVDDFHTFEQNLFMQHIRNSMAW